MSHDIENTFAVYERTTPDYIATLRDKNLNPVPGSVLDSLTLTYFHEYSRVIINGRDGQNVLQLNGVTIDENGVLTWTLSLEDTAILHDALMSEPHIARFDYTFPGLTQTEVGRKEVRILVDNLRRVM